jgi:DnaJ-class molecular chaperone
MVSEQFKTCPECDGAKEMLYAWLGVAKFPLYGFCRTCNGTGVVDRKPAAPTADDSTAHIQESVK